MSAAGISGEVVLGLLRDPAFSAAAEDLRKPDGHVRRNAALAVDEFGKSGARKPRAFAARVMVRPSGSMHSLRTTLPGARILHRHGETS